MRDAGRLGCAKYRADIVRASDIVEKYRNLMFHIVLLYTVYCLPRRELCPPSGYTVSMLSLFPQILFLAPFSALLIRVALAVVFAYSAWNLLRQNDTLSRGVGILEIVIAGLLIAGAWTQVAALAGLIFVGIHLVAPRLRTVALGTALLSFVLCLSLLVTGAGAFAFDLPL